MDFMGAISTLCIVIGLIAFVTSCIVEVIKNVSFLKKLPTDVVVFILSILLTVLTLVIYASVTQMVLLWYYFVGAVIIGFVVALVCMSGWSKVKDLFGRLVTSAGVKDKE